MKILTALSLALVAIGCTEFQQNQRNRAAQQYENLKFFYSGHRRTGTVAAAHHPAIPVGRAL